MSYYFSKVLSSSYEEAVQAVTEALKAEGFGVLTEIDVKATLKKKIDVDFRKYCILGACNPGSAHRALQVERNIGLLLPCNVVVQEADEGKVEVSIINPVVAMETVDNASLATIASEVTEKIEKVINSL